MGKTQIATSLTTCFARFTPSTARRNQAVRVLSSKIVQLFVKGKVVFHEKRP